jgi:hypothetical protein
MTPGRQYLTDAQWKAMFEAQGCHCDLCPNTDGPFIAEHTNPNYYKPGKPDRIICVYCDKPKTAIDRKNIAHTKRLNGESRSQRTRREERKAKGLPPLLRGAPFPSKKTRPRTASEILGEAP